MGMGDPASQMVRFSWKGEEREVDLPLIGEFQAANALGAAAMAIASGVSPDAAFEAMGQLTGVAGRLQTVGTTKDGAPVLLDYAHTPDGLDKLLRAAKAAVNRDGGERLKLVASPWSAPAWMKKNNNYRCPLDPLCFGCTLRDEYLPTWALYMRRYVDGYSALGLAPWARPQRTSASS